MQNKAIVLRVDGEVATVEVMRASACEGCHNNHDGQGCAACSLTGAGQKFSAPALNPIGAREGDLVEVETGTGRVLSYAFLVFVLPLLLGLGAYLVSGLLTVSEETRTFFLIAGFVLGLLGAGLYSRLRAKKKPDITVTKILSSDGDKADEKE